MLQLGNKKPNTHMRTCMHHEHARTHRDAAIGQLLDEPYYTYKAKTCVSMNHLKYTVQNQRYQEPYVAAMQNNK